MTCMHGAEELLLACRARADMLVDSEAARSAGIGQQAVQVTARALYSLAPRPTSVPALAVGG